MKLTFKPIQRLFIAVLVLLSLIPNHALAEKKLNFVVGTHASSNITNVYFEFLKIAYAELGYEATLKKVPIKRAYKNVSEGISDAMVIVSKDLLKTYENIIIVPEPLTTIDVVCISNDRKYKIEGPQSLKPYKVGILRGYTVTEKLTTGIRRQIVNNHDSLFAILEAGRVDIVLAMKRETKRFLKKNPQYKNIKILEPPVFSMPLYTCLNKKHEALVQEISPIIKRLIDEKVLEKLYKPYTVQ